MGPKESSQAKGVIFGRDFEDRCLLLLLRLPLGPSQVGSEVKASASRSNKTVGSLVHCDASALFLLPFSPLISLLRKLRLTIFPVTFPKKFKNLKNDSWRNSNGHFPSRVEIEHYLYLSEERKKEKEREREREREKRRREKKEEEERRRSASSRPL